MEISGHQDESGSMSGVDSNGGQHSDWGALPEESITRIKHAVAAGVREGLADPVTYAPAVAALTDPAKLDMLVAGLYGAIQRHAKAAAADTVASGVKDLLAKGFKFALAGVLLYSFFGPSALVAAWKVLMATKAGA